MHEHMKGMILLALYSNKLFLFYFPPRLISKFHLLQYSDPKEAVIIQSLMNLESINDLSI